MPLAVTYALSLLALLSAGLAFLRPSIFSYFVASLLNAMAVWAWWG